MVAPDTVSLAISTQRFILAKMKFYYIHSPAYLNDIGQSSKTFSTVRFIIKKMNFCYRYSPAYLNVQSTYNFL